MLSIDQEIKNYCQKHTAEESDLARSVQKSTDQQLEYSNMLSGRVVGQLLAMLIRISGAKKVLEIGTFTGYSALRMAGALPDEGSLITCEYNERYAAMARSAFEKSEHGQKITLKMSKALDTLKTLDETFDFIFLDADKVNYPNYYEALFPKLKSSGLLVIDNVLWSGEVLHPKDDKSKAIHELNQIIARDDRVEQVMLTVRDGMTIVRKVD